MVSFTGGWLGDSRVVPIAFVAYALGMGKRQMDVRTAIGACGDAESVPGIGMGGTVALLARLVDQLFKTRYALFSHAVFGVVLASTVAIIPFSFASSIAS